MTIQGTMQNEGLHAQIDLQAERSPLAPAVFAGDEVLSYHELVSRANRLANRLIAAGVQTETLVGICVDRSIDMVVGVLAILKAGGAFLPLDPAYPADRLSFMLTDSAVSVVVSQAAARAQLPEYAGKVVLIEDGLDTFPDTAPDVAIRKDHLAYVVYTSGSTGRPKGVMIEHGSVVSFLEWTRSRFSAAQMSRVLCSSSLSFDVAFFEIFAPLVCGGAVVVVADALTLLTDKAPQPISMISTVASALAELVRARAIPPSVSTVLQAGEYLPMSLARDLYATSNVSELLNLCGGTEDTIYSVSYLVPREPSEDPPIGRPFLDRAVYIVDENLNPVAAGVAGEICYGGSGVARGYLNRPELSAERFLPNPFGDSPRMYRSGDIVMEGADGEIRYLRRNDQQVKISGFRIELGEIEAVLREHPGVDQVAVLARETGGHKTLAAYAVERNPGSLAVDEVQAFVAQRLPEYMVPATLVLLDIMPMGPSGKLDRAALQSLERRRPELVLNYLAPRNSYEMRIAELVAELLGLDRVGVVDNFFALGGQSLLAARLVSELNSLYPQEIALLEEHAGAQALLTAFFIEPTVESLAAALATVATTHETPRALERIRCIQPGAPGVSPLFLFHGVIRGEAFYVWNLAASLGSERPLYAFAPHGYTGEEVPPTIEDMAREYLAAVRVIAPNGPYHFAGYCNGGLVAFEIARMLEAQGERVHSLVLISASARNGRFRALHTLVQSLGIVPGVNQRIRRGLFLKLRGRLILLERDGQGPLSKLMRLVQRNSKNKHVTLAPEFEKITRAERDEMRYMAFLEAIDAYMPKTYSGKITVIWGEDDPFSSKEDPYNGWREITRNVELRMVPGDHDFLESRPELISGYVRELLDSSPVSSVNADGR